MLSKNQIKRINSLQEKKFRSKYGFFVAEGYKVIDEFIKDSWELDHIYSTNINNDLNIKCDFTLITHQELLKISSLKTPSEILGVFKIPKTKPLSFKQSPLLFVFEEIQDPGNLGTIIRTADWFGIKQIFCGLKSVDVYNPKVVQASMGSLARVEVQYVTIDEIITKAKEHKYQLFRADLSGKNIFEHSFTERQMILFGNEGRGIDKQLKVQINDALYIPRQGGGESLNVAISAAITMGLSSRV